MSELRLKGWSSPPLEEVFEIASTPCVPSSTPDKLFAHHSLPAFDELDGPAYDLGGSIGSNKTLVARPSVLVSKLNPRIPRVSVVEQTSGSIVHCASTEFMVYQPRSEETCLPFYGHYFDWHFFQSRLERIATGTTNSHVRARPSETLKWPIPRPDSQEQRCIAEILDTADEAIRRTEQVIAKLKLIKQGLLHDLLTRGIDENGELRDPVRNPKQFKDSPLGKIPKAWEVKPVSDICQSSAFGPRFPGELYSNNGNIGTLRTTDLDEDGNISYETMPRAALVLNAYRSHILQDGDLLITRSGTCGIASVWTNNGVPSIPGAFLIRFRLELASQAAFLRFYFNAPFGRRRLERLAVGGVQKNIKGSEILSMYVPIPTEEREITDICTMIDRQVALEVVETEELTKLRFVKRGLMDDLLSGRVRVKV